MTSCLPSARPAERLFGPRVDAEGTSFRLWAPDGASASVVVGGRDHPLHPVADGFLVAHVVGAGPGTDYAFRIGDRLVPDPASRWQPAGVEGPSRVVDPALFGTNRRLGRPWSDSVIVEIHVGAATPEGSFSALAGDLDHYADLGATTLELMPIGAFPGRFNWGYDGVLPFAPAPAYGTPRDLVELIAAAHARGLAVLLDVVYNHFGPEGNFIPLSAPRFFDPGRATPWGAAIDLRDPLVRRFFLENMRLWVEDYGVDGLRLDAVHALHPEGRDAFLEEIAAWADGLAPRPLLVFENEHNEARLLARRPDGRPRVADAQWNDDAHNALHVALTGEREGYYAAFADDPVGRLARALAEGFVYQGEPNPLAGGASRGEPSAHLPPTAFVIFAQNHDQIGNRPRGDRLAAMLPPGAVALARFLTLMSPQIPLLFMGEEIGATTPFPYVCDVSGDLAAAVRAGRQREFAHFSGFAGTVPDATDPATFQTAKLDPAARSTPAARTAWQDTAALIAARREGILPLLASRFLGARHRVDGASALVEWRFEAGRLALAFTTATAPGVILPPDDLADLIEGDALAATGEVAVGDGRIRLGPHAAAAWVGE